MNLRSVIMFSVMLSLSLSACVSKKNYNLKVKELDETFAEVEDLEMIQANLEQDNQELRNEIARLRGDKDYLEKQMNLVSMEKEQEIQRLNSTYQSLVKNMEEEIKSGEIQITQLKDKLSMNILDKIIFPTGQASLSTSGKKVLDRIAKILKDVQDKRILIEGHTDNVPIGPELKKIFPTNWELSATRAINVARYLIERGKVSDRLVSIAGYADNKPIASNKTKEGRAKNRRIEILLVPIDLPVKDTPIDKPKKN
ncbi:MAG: OmpA family protein [Elusimicrobia bacterium]|nr:OmpA family protein [Elusimicrobiota bacterium]MBD3412057.1 OmpA family protein [Elusimicrobiota bacterium]